MHKNGRNNASRALGRGKQNAFGFFLSAGRLGKRLWKRLWTSQTRLVVLELAPRDPGQPDPWTSRGEHNFRRHVAEGVLVVSCALAATLLVDSAYRRVGVDVTEKKFVDKKYTLTWVPRADTAVQKKAGGGGGGGVRAPKPATKGELPKFSETQLAPPQAEKPKLQDDPPKIEVEPTVVVPLPTPPDITAEDLGEPLSNLPALAGGSSGEGSGGGIGTGTAGGVGPGSGRGVGLGLEAGVGGEKGMGRPSATIAWPNVKHICGADLQDYPCPGFGEIRRYVNIPLGTLILIDVHVIDEEGRVDQVVIVEGSGNREADEIWKKYLLQWRFPVLWEGKPVIDAWVLTYINIG